LVLINHNNIVTFIEPLSKSKILKSSFILLSISLVLTGCGNDDNNHTVSQEINIPNLGDAAFVDKLGTFAEKPPCSVHNWQLCAGDTSAPNNAPLQMGSPMAQPGLGIPLGGIGAGSFMLNRAGTFGPWNMGGSINGNYENRILPQAAFHIYEKNSKDQVKLKTLSINTSQFGSVMSAWDTLEKGKGKYSALYPFGKIDYGNVTPTTSVSTTFWSPIVANNDERTSQPIAYFDVVISNTSASATDVSTMFTFPNAPVHVANKVQNIPSKIESIRKGFTSNFQVDEQTNVKGITLSASDPKNTPDAQNSDWTIAVLPDKDQKVTYTTSWNGDGSGGDIYKAFSQNGTLPNKPLDNSNSAGALAVSVHLDAGQSKLLRFALAWDFPQISFGQNHETVWMRRYTSFYGGKQDNSNNYLSKSYVPHQGFKIASRNLEQRDKALIDVQNWWSPIANDSRIPKPVRMAALNELNQLVFNGSFWESGLVYTKVNPTTGGPRIGSKTPGEHLFHTSTGGGWMDGGEINVQAQASLAIQELFPNLAKSWALAHSQMVMQDPYGRVPEGPGNTDDSTWIQWPASKQPSTPGQTFIDTPLKFISRAYSLYKQTKDPSLLKEIYPAIVQAWQSDVIPRIPKDAVFPTNPEIFSNTYDVIGEDAGSTGSYVAGLYMLGLEIMIDATENAASQGLSEAKLISIAELQSKLSTARSTFDSMFWNDTYYKFTDKGTLSTDAFVDVIWPQYQAELMNLPDLFPESKIVKHMQTVYPILTQNTDKNGRLIGMPNIVPFKGVPYAFVENGLGFQRSEVWVGTNYENAAIYLREGKRFNLPQLEKYGSRLGEDIIYQAWDPTAAAEGSYAFNVPEAWNGYDTTTYRAANYVRVLAAWDLLKAYQNKK